jgi:hypothetical protein
MLTAELRYEETGLMTVLEIYVPFIEFARVCRIASFQDINCLSWKPPGQWEDGCLC